MRAHAPNQLQLVALAKIEPSEANVRLFVERESLESLENTYEAYARDPSSVVLPDPPTVRFRSKGQTLELLAGHRRLTAANNVGLKALPCRVVKMTDEEAYRYIRQANNYETLTTVEKAYAIAEMDRLGFSSDDIRDSMGDIGLPRYLAVGRMVHPDWFSDLEKKCDPSITLWGYALQHGATHFQTCFKHWDAGLWDEEDCHREFKRVGHARPPETYQHGVLISIDKTGTVARLRGTLDLNTMSPDELWDTVHNFTEELYALVILSGNLNNFGPKRVMHFEPDASE
jgi:hypothetical protein